MTDQELLARIEAFLEETGMAPTRFGREAMREASFIDSLRGGRSLSLRNANRVLRYMSDHRADESVSGHAVIDARSQAITSPGKSSDFSQQVRHNV